MQILIKNLLCLVWSVVISVLLLFVAVECSEKFTAWRFDLKFDVRCGTTSEFVVLGYMLFNGLGAEKHAGRYFPPKDDSKPFLYAQLDQTPADLTSAIITVGLELRIIADLGPRNIEDMLISMIHVGETLKLRLRDIPLKNDTSDFRFLSTKFEVVYENFEREKKNDCYVDSTYYLHGEVATTGRDCSKSIAVCRCDNGIANQNCQLVPQKCSISGGYFDRQTTDTVCKWKMQNCCPEVRCPMEMPYCLNNSTRTNSSPLLFVIETFTNILLLHITVTQFVN